MYPNAWKTAKAKVTFMRNVPKTHFMCPLFFLLAIGDCRNCQMIPSYLKTIKWEVHHFYLDQKSKNVTSITPLKSDFNGGGVFEVTLKWEHFSLTQVYEK